MELTSEERSFLVFKKNEIRQLTTEILDLLTLLNQDTEIMKKMTSVLSLITTISSYAKITNIHLERLWKRTNYIFAMMKLEDYNSIGISLLIERWCNTVNSIEYDFSKRGFKFSFKNIAVNLFPITTN